MAHTAHPPKENIRLLLVKTYSSIRQKSFYTPALLYAKILTAMDCKRKVLQAAVKKGCMTIQVDQDTSKPLLRSVGPPEPPTLPCWASHTFASHSKTFPEGVRATVGIAWPRGT